MIQEISSYCSPSEINDSVSDSLSILKRNDFTAHTYFNNSIQEVDSENNNLSLTIGTVRSSKFAAILEENDNTRDRILMGLTQVTKACILREDKLTSASAIEVYRAIKAHGLGLKRQGYQSESAGIDSLAAELGSDKMKSTIDTLPESKAFLQELIAANGKFKNDFDANMAHKAEIEKLDAPSVQKKLVRHLFNTKVVRFVNMMSDVDPATFAPIAKQLAPYTEKINLTAKSRRSRKEQETAIVPEAN
tara:strand:+ start:191 stop:934 length:744 start_codon:yes stop_codon:yes gene_type:complete